MSAAITLWPRWLRIMIVGITTAAAIGGGWICYHYFAKPVYLAVAAGLADSEALSAAAFWSFTLYDNQTRSMLDTPQRYPRAGSQTYPSPAAEANADGSTTIYFGPIQPADVKRGNWIQTVPCKGCLAGRARASDQCEIDLPARRAPGFDLYLQTRSGP
jgi:hypothetical protein